MRDLTLAWAGVDDPHLEYDDLAAVRVPRQDEVVAVGGELVEHQQVRRVRAREP